MESRIPATHGKIEGCRAPIPHGLSRIEFARGAEEYAMWTRIRREAPVSKSARAACQQLESRLLLSLAPAGAEFRVNTVTSGTQQLPAIALDGDGDFLVAWQSNSQELPTGVEGIFAQRYGAPGLPQGAELHVNTFTTGSQANPAVAADADGDVVVVWQGPVAGIGANAIFAQRYSAAGVPQGGEFRVNQPLPGTSQNAPAVAMDAAGNFVVAWQDIGTEPASNLGVFAQRFDFTGLALGGQFHVNTYTTGVQRAPAVAMDAAGDFVVAWQGYLQDGGGGFPDTGVYAQRYDAGGRGRARSSASTRTRRARRARRPSPATPTATSSSPGTATGRTAATTACTRSVTTRPARRAAASFASTRTRPIDS
jgi:hypothetical protein